MLTVPFPIITVGSTLDYDSTAQTLDVSGTPGFFLRAGLPPESISAPSDFSINIAVDNTGQLIGGSIGDDLVVEGEVDTTGDNENDATGVLLTGEICSFNVTPVDVTTDTYEFRFLPTGGALESFYSGFEIGVSLDGIKSAFGVDFMGPADGSLGTLAPSASIGDFVWEDTNGNGVQDGGETGVSGITVTLVGGGANGIVGDVDDTTMTTTTGLNGEYLFEELMPCRQYQVTFSDLPAGFSFTDADAGNNDALDSDADAFGVTPIVTPGADEFFDSIDAGIVEVASLGDTVWTDANENGIRDGVESGVPGVTVTLTGGGPNEVIGDADDTTASVVTGPSGDYLFDNLDPGEEFQVTFSNLPAGFEFTEANVGLDDSIDSDADEITGSTPIVTLASAEFNDSLDAGLVPIPSNPHISIEKLTNGVDADTPATAVEVMAGSTVTWSYLVTNTGDVPFPSSEVEVVDDNGTPSNAADDFSVDSGDITLVASSDVGNDGILSPNETWTFTAQGTALSLSASGQSGLFYLTGNSSTDGPDGNVRTFSSSGVSVNVSAFSRNHYGHWSTAYLGAYSEGLGVTDSNEGHGGNGSHRVDNVGDPNYVLFEFSESVVVDSAFLDSVYHSDSDISVWIGSVNDPFNNHISLSDSTLANLGTQEDSWGDWHDRWAYFNSAGVAGNVLVIAASTSDSSPEDQFKLRKIGFETVADPIFKNIGTATANSDAGTVSDNDPSHYINPAITPDPHSCEVQTSWWWFSSEFVKAKHSSSSDVADSYELYDYHGNHLKTVHSSSTSSQGYNSHGLWELSWNDSHYGFHAPSVYYVAAKNYGSDVSGMVHCNRTNYSPIAVDLNGDGEIGVTGESTTQGHAYAGGPTVQFDIDADGSLDTIEWFSGDGDGILVDSAKIGDNGEINGSALFGDEGGLYANGYEKLARLDSDNDNAISGDELAGLALWLDDGDAVLEDGELSSLLAHDLVALSTAMQLDSQGRMRSSALRADGSRVMTEDVWFAAADSTDEDDQSDSSDNQHLLATDRILAEQFSSSRRSRWA